MNGRKINLKFCFKLGKVLTETYSMLVRFYEDEALSMKCEYEWFTHVREDRESLSDHPRSGRHATSISDGNTKQMGKLISKDVDELCT
ncbi:hypothetical protein TNCV_539341 [Trichonephila clavipes]|nr:hypothetical protein TNCV_539341 [Trichonephila clavipes]